VCVCVWKWKVDRLAQFLRSFSADDRRLEQHESVLKARAVIAFHAGAYDELYRLLECNHFSTSSHAAMQSLWLRAHYRDAERSRGGLPLGAVGKYRIRRRQVNIWRLSVLFGRPTNPGYVFCLFSFYPTSSLKWQNLTKTCDLFGSECDLKMRVQDFGYPLPLKSGAQNHLFWTLFDHFAT